MRAGLCASRMVSVAARPGHTPLGPPLKPAKKCGSTKPVQDADVGVDVAGVEPDRHAVDPPHHHVVVVVGPVVVDAVARHDVGPDQLGHLGRRGLAVGAGGAQQLHPLGPGAQPFELGQQRRQHRAVGHRPGQVGEHHGHLVAPARPGRPAAGPTPARAAPSTTAPASSASPADRSAAITTAVSGTSTVSAAAPVGAGRPASGRTAATARAPATSPRPDRRVGRAAGVRSTTAAATRSAAGRSSR